MAKDYSNVRAIYDATKAEREHAKPLWDTISKYTGISVDTDYLYNNNAGAKSSQKDEYIDDPTAALCVNQAGDYLSGIMWGTGDKVLDVIPSRYVLEYAKQEELEDYYGYVTDQTLYHWNHSDAGWNSVLRPYCYDQFSFGTAGIGAFPNPQFAAGIDENAIIFKQYGVDNMCIEEGKSGIIEVVFATYHWRVNRIVSEFCGNNPSPAQLAKLPDKVVDAWKAGNYGTEYTVVFGMMPRADYDPKLKGKRGARYKGIWFMEDDTTCSPFHEEDFHERPINVGRQIKVRGETWGRASGTMFISSIRSVNFLLSQGIETVEKMNNPSLGIWGNSIFGDSVLDTSPNGLTAFNAALAGGKEPTWKLYDVGDPSGILEFMVPYLNEKITTGFKVDALLDFSSAKEMTATESLQRYAIRGKSLSGMLGQQKSDCLVPTGRRVISILDNQGQLGVDPTKATQAMLAKLKEIGRSDRIIPEAVMKVKAAGRPWYEIRFNNELEKLTRTEVVQNLVQLLQAVTAIVALNPQIVAAIDWYKLLQEINTNLDSNSQLMIGEDEFKAQIEEAAQAQRDMMSLQMAQAGATTAKDASQAQKTTREAQNVGRQG